MCNLRPKCVILTSSAQSSKQDFDNLTCRKAFALKIFKCTIFIRNYKVEKEGAMLRNNMLFNVLRVAKSGGIYIYSKEPLSIYMAVCGCVKKRGTVLSYGFFPITFHSGFFPHLASFLFFFNATTWVKNLLLMLFLSIFHLAPKFTSFCLCIITSSGTYWLEHM